MKNLLNKIQTPLTFFSCLIFTLTSFCHADQEGMISSNGIELFYKSIGEGEPIIVLHGGPGLDHTYLLPQMEGLAKNKKVIFYDQRGCGRSEGNLTPESISIDNYVEDLEGLRQKLNLDQIAVLGHSWGSILGIKYALKYPQHLKSLILLHPAPISSEGWHAFADELHHRFAPFLKELRQIEASEKFANGDPETVALYFRTIFKTYCCNPEDVSKLSLLNTKEANLRGREVNHIFHKNLFGNDFNYFPILKDIPTNTLIVQGRCDPIAASQIEKIHRSMTNSQYVLMKDCGHFSYAEHPEELFPVLQEFLSK